MIDVIKFFFRKKKKRGIDLEYKCCKSISRRGFGTRSNNYRILLIL